MPRRLSCPVDPRIPGPFPRNQRGRLVTTNAPAQVNATEQRQSKGEQKPMSTETKCPFTHASGATSNRDWWPNQLRLDILHQHSSLSNPMGAGFSYTEEFKTLDLAAVKKDLLALMT